MRRASKHLALRQTLQPWKRIYVDRGPLAPTETNSRTEPAGHCASPSNLPPLTRSRPLVQPDHAPTVSVHESRLLHPCQQRQFQPLPVAVHIPETDLPQPIKLGFPSSELIGWVLRFRGNSKRIQKTPVELLGYGCNMLEIAENATGR